MNIRQTRTLLWSLAAFMALSAIVTVALGLSRPLQIHDPGQAAPRSIVNHSTSTSAGTDASATPINVATTTVWQRHFRGPLYDPPPPPKPAPAPPPPPPPLRINLLGTAVETDPDRSQAMITDSTGKMRFARIGDVIDEATITAIDTASITVEYQNETRTLTPRK